MKKRASSFWQSSTALTLVSTGGVGVAIVLSQLLTGLLFVILARRLDAEPFGVLAAVFSVSLAIGGLVDFGSSQLWTRNLAKGEGLSYFRSWLIRRTALSLIPSAAVVIGSTLVARDTVGPIAAVSLASQCFLYPLAQGTLAGVRALRSPALAAWFVAIGNFVAPSVALVAPRQSLTTLTAIGAAISWVITAGLAVWALRTRLPQQERLLTWNPWRRSGSFGLSGVGTGANGFHLSIIAALAGPNQAALAAAVSKWVQPIRLIPSAYTANAFPDMAKSDSDLHAVALLKPFRVLFSVGIALIGGIMVFADMMVGVVLGPAFSDAAWVLRLHALSTIPVLIAQPLGSLLQARGHDRVVAKYHLLGGVLGLIAVASTARVLGAASSPIVVSVYGTVFVALLTRRVRSLS